MPLAGIPFDEGSGLIRNEGGRVCTDDGEHCAGEYVTGWIKRGPSGVIGTNKKDSQDTIDKLLEDAAAGRLNEPTHDDVEALLVARAPHTSSGTAGRRSTPSSAPQPRGASVPASSSSTGMPCEPPRVARGGRQIIAGTRIRT